MLRQALDINGSTWSFSDFETTLWLLLWIGNQQVLNLLIVNFKHGELHLELGVITFICITLGDPPENLITSNRNNALVGAVPNHGITLAGASLAVRKQAAVIALPGIVEHLLAETFVDLLLRGVLALAVLLL